MNHTVYSMWLTISNVKWYIVTYACLSFVMKIYEYIYDFNLFVLIIYDENE